MHAFAAPKATVRGARGFAQQWLTHGRGDRRKGDEAEGGRSEFVVVDQENLDEMGDLFNKDGRAAARGLKW